MISLWNMYWLRQSGVQLHNITWFLLLCFVCHELFCEISGNSLYLIYRCIFSLQIKFISIAWAESNVYWLYCHYSWVNNCLNERRHLRPLNDSHIMGYDQPASQRGTSASDWSASGHRRFDKMNDNFADIVERSFEWWSSDSEGKFTWSTFPGLMCNKSALVYVLAWSFVLFLILFSCLLKAEFRDSWYWHFMIAFSFMSWNCIPDTFSLIFPWRNWTQWPCAILMNF